MGVSKFDFYFQYDIEIAKFRKERDGGRPLTSSHLKAFGGNPPLLHSMWHRLENGTVGGGYIDQV